MIRLSTGLRNALVLNAGLGEMMNGGIIRVYGGSPPSSPDDPPAATLLATITTDGKVFYPGNDTEGAGLLLSYVSPASIVKNGRWMLKGVGSGVAAWWRWCWSLPDDQYYSTYYPRIDGDAGPAGALVLSAVDITPATLIEIGVFQVVFPLA